MTGKKAHNPERLPPIHPGEILNEEFLLPMKITQYRLAKAIGVDARRIHSIVHGQRSITAETALLLARFFGNSPAFWMGLAEPARPRGGGGAAVPQAGIGEAPGTNLSYLPIPRRRINTLVAQFRGGCRCPHIFAIISIFYRIIQPRIYFRSNFARGA